MFIVFRYTLSQNTPENCSLSIHIGGDAKYFRYTNSGNQNRDVRGPKVSQRQKLVNGTQKYFWEKICCVFWVRLVYMPVILAYNHDG